MGAAFHPLLADAAQVIIAGHAFIQNLRRGHYDIELGTRRPPDPATAFNELARAV